MAFSRSEERGMQPVSISYSSSTSPPPTSPHTYHSATAEEAVVDADAIERWLTSPAKPETTDARTNETLNGNGSPRQKLLDVAISRRKQKRLNQNQALRHPPATDVNAEAPALRAVVSQESEEENSEHGTTTTTDTTASVIFGKDKRESMKESNQFASIGNITRREGASPGIAAIRRRRQQRLKRRELEKEIEKEGQEGQSMKTSTATAVISDTRSSLCSTIGKPPSNMSATTIPISPPASRVQIHETDFRNAGIENKSDDKYDSHNHTYESDMIAHSNRNNVATDGRALQVSRTKKIHLLKRHGAARGGSPLLKTADISEEVREININATPSLHNDTKQVTINSDENGASTIGRLRIARHQLSQGNNKGAREHEHAHEQRSLPHVVDDSAIASPSIREYHPSTNSDNVPSNVDNTRRIKEALARARSLHRSVSKRIAENNEIEKNLRTYCGETYGERELKNRFQSGSIPCSSVISTGTSTVSVVSDESSSKSNNSRISEEKSEADGDDEVTSMSSTSGTTSEGHDRYEEDFSELSTPTELGAMVENVPECSFKASSLRDSERTSVRYTERSMPKSIEESAIVEATIGSSSAKTRKQSDMQKQGSQLVKTNRIKLHVYDLLAEDTQLDLWGCHFPVGQVFNALNSSLHSIGTGAYHVGLEIDGTEYAYGANSTKGLTGIFTCMPRSSPGYQFRTTIDFGSRVVKNQSSNEEAVDGKEIVRRMATEYLGTDYDLLRKNCCTFARDVCIRLGIGEEEIPSWFHNLAAVGAVTQDAANYTLAPITQIFSGSELDKFTDYLNETALHDKLEAMKDWDSDDEKKNVPITHEAAYQF